MYVVCIKYVVKWRSIFLYVVFNCLFVYSLLLLFVMFIFMMLFMFVLVFVNNISVAAVLCLGCSWCCWRWWLHWWWALVVFLWFLKVHFALKTLTIKLCLALYSCASCNAGKFWNLISNIFSFFYFFLLVV